NRPAASLRPADAAPPRRPDTWTPSTQVRSRPLQLRDLDRLAHTANSLAKHARQGNRRFADSASPERVGNFGRWYKGTRGFSHLQMPRQINGLPAWPEAYPDRTPGPLGRRGAGRNLHLSDVSELVFRPRHYLCAYPSACVGAGSRSGDLAAAGEHLPVLCLRPVGATMAATPCPRGRHHGAICRRQRRRTTGAAFGRPEDMLLAPGRRQAVAGGNARTAGSVCVDAAWGEDASDPARPLRGAEPEGTRRGQAGDVRLSWVHPHLRAQPAR